MNIQEHIEEINQLTLKTKEDAEAFRLRFLSKKNGVLTHIFNQFRELPGEEKKIMGKQINELKTLIENKLNEFENQSQTHTHKTDIDISLPGEGTSLGTQHPISIVGNKINQIFTHMGFAIAEGPEVEDDWHNFTALNFPEEHPARDMQDTFFVQHDEAKKYLLRTHTSNVQTRLMEKGALPIRAIMPGRVYRNETISARAHCIFHQVEGLFVDKDVSFADLKQCIYLFVEEMFGKGTKVRFRPSYFPFTEPSAEVDISCFICNQKGCNICKKTGWVEIMGCGMVDPNVLENCKIDSSIYSGFAFGMGIERITMLKFGIPDLRLFFENDVRFLNQFKYAKV